MLETLAPAAEGWWSRVWQRICFQTWLKAIGTSAFSTGAAEHTLLVGVDWQKADWTAARGAMGTATDTPTAIDIRLAGRLAVGAVCG